MAKRAGIPHVDLTVERKVRDPLVAIKENVEVMMGVRGGTGVNSVGWKLRCVTLEDLVQLGLATEEDARRIWMEP